MRLVFIYGPPASGKLTIAKELAVLTGLALFHNHLIVDAVAAVFPFGSEPFIRLREQFWLAVLREAAEAGRSTIFTFAPEASVAPGFPDRVRHVVRSAGGDVAFIRLGVSPAEQERRILDSGRAAFGKLRSLALLRELRPQFEACEATMPAPDVSIDTEAMAPTRAAQVIRDGLGLSGK